MNKMTGNRNRRIWTALSILLLLHFTILFAGFVAPNSPTIQNRDFPYAPPTHLHFVDTSGHIHVRPFVYQYGENDHEYIESHEREYPIHFFIVGPEYKIAGIFSSHIHLLGVEAPAQLFLAGTDGYGRDEFSRVLYGGQVSLAAGLLATGICLSLGLMLGTISGFHGGWVDESVMRVAELFVVLPWLYLLLAVRAFLPLHINPKQAFFLLIAVIGTIAWARPARLVRGIVLSAKTRKYVVASRSFGASGFYILRRHVLPETYGTLLTQATLLIPQFVLAEVTLSFFGLGLSEPLPSWGTELATLQQYNVMVSCWWMFAPGIVLVVFSLGYLAMANALQQQLQSGVVSRSRKAQPLCVV